MTTALVAAFSATNVCAEDWTISSKEIITDELISRDNVTVATGGDITISGNDSGIIANGNFVMNNSIVKRLLDNGEPWSTMWLKYGQEMYPYDDNFKAVSNYAIKNKIKK